MKIAVLDDYQDVVRDLECFKLLSGHQVDVLNEALSEPELIIRLKTYDALVLIRERTVITENLLANLPNLKVISQTGKVSNHISVDLCNQYNVEVLEGVGSPVAPAELCWTLIMAASRHLTAYVSHFQKGQWQQNGSLGLGSKLQGKTLGIWGYGKIGQRIARYALAFDMKVLVWGREPSRALAVSHGHQVAESKYEFFSRSDIVTLHLRLNDTTKYCVRADDLKVMKEGSILVNTSRAELIEAGALLDEMRSNPKKFAALDVYSKEPLIDVSEDALLGLPNVLASPHLGYVEQSGYELYFNAAFENLANFKS
ncbi:D-2-hydroxyacid dehydrogenase family protein [Marinomonas epiphytica]